MTNRIYLFKAGQFYKIGVSINPEKRARTLQTGCPHKIEIVYQKIMHDAYAAEFSLHHLYQSKRTHGEWFDGIDHAEFVRAVDYWINHNEDGLSPLSFKDYFQDIDCKYIEIYHEISKTGEVCKNAHLIGNDAAQIINAGIKQYIKNQKATT